MQPEYLYSQIIPAANAQQLLSSNYWHLFIPRIKTNIRSRFFSVAAPSLWNTPPDNVKSTNTVISASNGMTFHHQPDLPTVMDSPYLLRFGGSKYGVTALLQIIRQRAVAVKKIITQLHRRWCHWRMPRFTQQMAHRYFNIHLACFSHNIVL